MKKLEQRQIEVENKQDLVENKLSLASLVQPILDQAEWQTQVRAEVQELLKPTTLRVAEDREILAGVFQDILDLKKDNKRLHELVVRLQEAPWKKEILAKVERKCLALRTEAEENYKSLAYKCSSATESIRVLKSRTVAFDQRIRAYEDDREAGRAEMVQQYNELKNLSQVQKTFYRKQINEVKIIVED